MKCKLTVYTFWVVTIVTLIVVVLGTTIFVLVAIQTNEFRLLWFLLLIVVLLIVLWRDRINIWAIITIDKNGVLVTCFGKKWFEKSWDEIKYIGEFETGIKFTTYQYMYFSTIPIMCAREITKKGGPSNSKWKRKTVFMMLLPEARRSVLKYVDEKAIIQHGWISPL